MGVTAYCACCCPLASIPKGLWTKLYHSQLPTFIYSPRQHHPLPSFLFFWFPSFFPSFLVSPPSPSDYCSVYQSFGRLTHQAMQEVRLALLGFKKKKKDRQKKKKPHPNPTGQDACSRTGLLVWTLLCLCVGASCVSKSRQPTAILLLAPNSLIHSFVQSIASPPQSHFISLPWCGVSPSFLQDYTVENLLLLSWPAFFSPGKNTHTHRPTLYSMPLQRANSFLLSLYFSLVGH